MTTMTFMVSAIDSVHPVHLMNVEQHQVTYVASLQATPISVSYDYYLAPKADIIGSSLRYSCGPSQARHCSNGIQTAPKAVHSAIQQQSRENCLKTFPVISLTNKQIDYWMETG